MTNEPTLTQRMITEFNVVRASDAYMTAQVLTLVMFAGGTGAALASAVVKPIPDAPMIVLMLAIVPALLCAPDLITFIRSKAKTRRR